MRGSLNRHGQVACDATLGGIGHPLSSAASEPVGDPSWSRCESKPCSRCPRRPVTACAVLDVRGGDRRVMGAFPSAALTQ